jgi:hypothetical protein
MDAQMFLVIFSPIVAIALFFLEEGFDIDFETKYRIHKFLDKFVHPFRAAWYTIRNFSFWGWSLKDDRNWDFYFLYYILALKLKLMRKSLADGVVEAKEKKKILKPLDRAIVLCERLRDQDYNKYHDRVEAKYGKLHLSFNPSNHKGLSSGYFWNENCIYPREQRRADKAGMRANMLDMKEEVKDRRELFKIIAENINKWWD